MAFPGSPSMRAASDGMSDQERMMVQAMQMGMESCVGKSAISGVVGFGLGGFIGLFMASMSYDVPGAMTAQGQAISDLPWREQLRRGFKDMGSRSWSSAKNFGMIGALFAGTECCVEGLRAKNDIYNGVLSGCITGGLISMKAGPSAALIGCGGFAAFSTAIEAYMRQPAEPAE